MFAVTAYGDGVDLRYKSHLAVDFSQASNEEITHAAQVDAQRYWNASREYMVKRNQVSSFSEEHAVCTQKQRRWTAGTVRHQASLA